LQRVIFKTKREVSHHTSSFEVGEKMKFLSKKEVVAQNPNINNVWVVAYAWYENGHLADSVIEGFLISANKPEIPNEVKENLTEIKATDSEDEVIEDGNRVIYINDGPVTVSGYHCIRLLESKLF
jgi:hypothetical protein